MAKLLMITGLGSAEDLASGKKGAFYNTLEEFHKYWERIDIIAPKIINPKSEILNKYQIQNSKSKIIILFGNVFVHISPWPLVFHPVWFLKKGLEIFKEQKFDLITVHEFPPFYNGIAARILWQKIKVPYVLEIMHIPGYPKAANFKERFYRLLTKIFIKFDAKMAKAVRVINKKETPEFLTKAGVPRQKLVYIPAFYIDLNIFNPQEIKKEYDLIFVGHLAENKGINLFIDTVKKLNVAAVIVGDGPFKKDIKLKIMNYKLNIDVRGWARDSVEVAELINKSKILIMSSYNEGGPRVVIEAMACGVPVLATNVGIVPDLLKNGSGGEIIDWKADDMAQKVLGLLNDPDRYQRHSQSGPEIAKQFEKKEAIKNYADKLKEILG